MTPKQAYDHIAARSRRMLRFHDGLVNTRQRGIRNDWKGAFCKLMHWPHLGGHPNPAINGHLKTGHFG